MSDSIWPWIILAIIAIVAIALVIAMMKKRKTEEHRARAAELRNDAVARVGDVKDHDLRAREAEAEAERKRVEAERAEREAHQARQGHVQEQASVEDRVREADRLDPDVDHRADDYEPRADLHPTDQHQVEGQHTGSHEGHGTDGSRDPYADGQTDPNHPHDPGTSGSHRGTPT